ncbi:hypothetical protein [Methanoregula sp.]|uniref:hypothetical protein n=1 Tax=Methanoregula sp. TaxID=2052170 RepID=UPI003566BCBA
MVAQYRVSSGSDVAPSSYSLNSEVRYRDSLDNRQISDRFWTPQNRGKTCIQRDCPGAPDPCHYRPDMGGAGYYLLVMRKKK